MNPYVNSILAAFHRQPKPSFVSIDTQKLRELAERFAEEEFKVPSWRAPVFFEKDSPEFIDFLGVGNSINFCFRDPGTKQRFRMEYQGGVWEGAFGMWASLTRALEEGIPVLDAEFLADNLTLDLTRHIFRGDPPIPMLEERFNMLQETGFCLTERYGSFHQLFEDADFLAFNNGKGIVERLVQDVTSFFDVNRDPRTGRLLEFHKRANLLVLMYQGRALDSGGALSIVKDAADLTPPADYEVPKSLKYLGILKYRKELEQTISRQEPIIRDTASEIDIRAQTVGAMFVLCKRINTLRKDPISIVELDYKLWSEGRSSPDPHHLTETTAY